MRLLWPLLAVLLAPALLAQMDASDGPSPRTEMLAAPEQWPQIKDAVGKGLAFLAGCQTEGGYWTGHVGHKRGDDYLVLTSVAAQTRSGHGHMGVTSLAGLAFLAGGHLPDRGRYGKHVRRTLDYVLERMTEHGYIHDSGTRMYSHAFATLFLAQIYGMVGEQRIKTGLERAVHWIVDCQNRQGGWRYNAFTQEADLSVTVCQLQALRAARNIGIKVPRRTIERAVDYVRRSRTESGPYEGLFYYKIEGRSARRKNREYAINAAAVTSLFSAGVYEQDLYGPALDFLEEEYPYLALYYRRHFFYWYGNYYASQAFFHAGGDRFRAYHRRICADLLEDQQEDGRWRNDVGPGDVLGTAVACLIMQIPYQYLPIFQR